MFPEENGQAKCFMFFEINGSTCYVTSSVTLFPKTNSLSVSCLSNVHSKIIFSWSKNISEEVSKDDILVITWVFKMKSKSSSKVMKYQFLNNLFAVVFVFVLLARQFFFIISWLFWYLTRPALNWQHDSSCYK